METPPSVDAGIHSGQESMRTLGGRSNTGQYRPDREGGRVMFSFCQEQESLSTAALGGLSAASEEGAFLPRRSHLCGQGSGKP